MSTNFRDLLERVANERALHIEMYAAAFLREVGTQKASEYILVERHEDNKITWSFEQKHEQKNQRPHC